MFEKLRVRGRSALAVVIVFLGALVSLGLLSGWSAPWYSVLLAFGLAWLSVIDVERMLLPDALTLSLLGIGLAVSAASGWQTLSASLVGCLAGYLVLTSIGLGFQRLRGVQGLGGGDAKLLAAGGAWVGWSFLPVVVLSASGLALVFAPILLRREGGVEWSRALPFGPFLAAGIWVGWCLVHRN